MNNNDDLAAVISDSSPKKNSALALSEPLSFNLPKNLGSAMKADTMFGWKP